MVTKVSDVWVCSGCGDLQGKHDQWFEGDLCEKCNAKYEPREKQVHEHVFRIIRKSGAIKGIAMWKCITCNKVVQST